MVFSASQYFARYAPYNDSYYFLKSQLTNAGVGAVLMLLAYKMDYRLYRKLSYPAYLVVLGLLVFMVLSSQIEEVGGAKRWIEVAGQNFQPSELAKIALPMALAKFMTDHYRSIPDFKGGFLPALGLTGLTAGLIFMQKALSNALVVGTVGFIMMIVSGVRGKYMSGTIALGLAGVGGAIIMEPYRMNRIYAWLDPWSDPQVGGYQTIQSLLALGNGGLTGVGLGSGGSKWFYLPAQHTDFIFSVLGEEMGFLGALFVMLLLVFIIWRGMLVAVRVRNFYASLLAMGMICSIAVQTMINLGVVTGLLPVTGVTLPFVSYGGSSLVVCMVMIGMLLNISRHTEK